MRGVIKVGFEVSDRKRGAEQDKRKRAAICIFLALLIFLTGVAVFFLNRDDGKDREAGGVVYENTQNLNDEKTPLGAAASSRKIIFPGFTSKTLKFKSDEALKLQNPSGNSMNFVYYVLFGDKKIYESRKIHPGDTVDWSVGEFFKKAGEYEITVLITPYDNDGVQKNGFRQEITIEIIK